MNLFSQCFVAALIACCSLGSVYRVAYAETKKEIGEGWGWEEDVKNAEMPFDCWIELSPERYQKADRISVSYTISAKDASGVNIYNPFLNQLLSEQTCLFLIFDEDRKFLGRANVFVAGSSRQPIPSDWLYVPSGASVKHSVQVALPAAPLHPLAARLPTGKYFLQLVFKQNSITQPPTHCVKDEAWRLFLARFRSKEWKMDYMRSNAIAFEVK
jgi:hypothetical protein